jgi:hypothetical protein
LRTALVTPVWLNEVEYELRCAKWARHHVPIAKAAGWDLVVLDNGSEFDLPDEYGLPDSHIRFPIEYRRPTHLDYPYAWRALYAATGDLMFSLLEYDKIIFCENDFFVLTQRLVDWADAASGFVPLYSERFQMPESAFFVCTKEHRPTFGRPWKDRVGEVLEVNVPWTGIERGTFIGDRYEACAPPAGCDFAAQVRLEDPVPWTS